MSAEVVREKTINEVRLSGRVSYVSEERTTPSGSRVLSIRVVVPRDGESPRVDSVEVTCWSARVRRLARELNEGDHVWVDGSLRRRFFSAAGIKMSRYEIEAFDVQKLRAAT